MLNISQRTAPCNSLSSSNYGIISHHEYCKVGSFALLLELSSYDDLSAPDFSGILTQLSTSLRPSNSIITASIHPQAPQPFCDL